MEQQQPTSSRKKFVLWGLGILSSLTAFRLFSQTPSTKNKKTVKMLDQDGKLVEVDAEKLFCGKRKKISDEQLKNWVTRK